MKSVVSNVSSTSIFINNLIDGISIVHPTCFYNFSLTAWLLQVPPIIFFLIQTVSFTLRHIAEVKWVANSAHVDFNVAYMCKACVS